MISYLFFFFIKWVECEKFVACVDMYMIETTFMLCIIVLWIISVLFNSFLILESFTFFMMVFYLFSVRKDSFHIVI